MKQIFFNKEKVKTFHKTIVVTGDKSLSVRWVLFSSLAQGKSKAYNLLKSEDVLATIKAIKKFGIKVNLKKIFAKLLEMDYLVIDIEKILLSMQKILEL